MTAGFWRFAGLLLAILPAIACTTPLRDFRPGEAPPEDTAEAGYWMVSDKAERRLKTSGRLVDAPALDSYVNDIACDLTPAHCDSIRVYVVRQADFNATMMANGVMSIWSGLLLRATNEAQLATVIGHEIAHFTRRHTWARMQDLRATTNAALMFKVAVAMAGVPSAQSLVNLIAQGHIMDYSRDQEREADHQGFEMMVEAGYRAAEAPAIWRGLIAEREAGALERPPLFFASHPPSEERMATLDDLAARRGDYGSGKAHKVRYLQQILPHRGDWLRDELALRRWDRARVLLNRLQDQGARRGELFYYRGELHRRRDEPGDREKAVAAYKKGLAQDSGAPGQIHRSLGLVRWSQNQPGKARAAFQRYLEAVPNAQDRDMIESYVDRLSGEMS